MKSTKFEATGTVKAVNAAAGTVTVAVKGGTKEVRGKTVTVKVPPTVRIVVNGARKTLADIGTGFQIAVGGTQTGTVYLATKVTATGKKVRPVPSPTVSPSPSIPVTPSPSESVTPAPSDGDVTPAPSDGDVTPAPSDDDVTPEPSGTPEPSASPDDE
ncbi:MAG TPA: hypothetical protein VGB74_09390 [Actinoplanes sp.]